ncbi:ATP-grasp enzyme [Rhodococcus antarcticus]|uniref:ATP-grasp enzyme n=1 Tax=Rhodococcus antarcticus TaxID=2987751 RepID=A0ABY6NZM6_9NOCA|nr:ATP-grasp enzyme [Rhodococcus antarcticus]UZJ24561.1 ATP-grasp enzyme [Rhodococcus antarcticus]
MRDAARTVGMLGLLTAVAPVNLLVTGAALLRSAVRPPARQVAAEPRTVLVSGGKMTKALQLARSFHAAGHRVVLVEQGTYRLTGHRFSRAVDRFHVVPAPDAAGYTQALLDIVRAEGVDVYVPVCSPVASYHDAVAKAALSPFCEVVHLDPDELRDVDDKDRFAALAASLGLRVPETHRVTAPAQVAAFDFAATGLTYILKSIAYDPVRRLDLTPLPRPTPAQTLAFAASLPISEDNPWILQELVTGQEYCTHGTVRGGEVQVWACCESSASQLNYAEVDKPAIEEWVRTFCRATGVTGQLSFDVIEEASGEVVAIECNPRTHSAITMFHDHPDLARAYLEDGVGPITPLPGSLPTYWLYQEVWRLATQPGTRRARLRTILAGKDAIFSLDDPLPFLMVHHVHIPWLLVQNLRRGGSWLKIDVNIGKLVEPGGD